jgi:myo-inositol 2-dehydrogenase / D-chiro-inositol 1-dehydrogenase
MSRIASSRRDFLKVSAGVAAAGAVVPYVFSSGQARAEGPNDKLGVGCIGVGGRGSGVGREAAGKGRLVACCDVDRGHAERFAAGGKDVKCEVYTDYRKLLERKDIDVVTIGTPDHWHVPVAIAALKAGKDVYCEKPLTLTIDEGKMICKVVQETKRVFQVGTQQRSDKRFLTAIAIARSGRLGKTLVATCSIGGAPKGGPFPASEPPAGLDWDFWLGQCPKVPFTKERCHGNFRWWLEYSGGKLTDWGAHHVDIAQWGIGGENTGPIEIDGPGEFPNIPESFNPVEFFAGKATLPNGYNTATKFHIDLKFASGSKIHVQDGPDNGIWFEGSEGKIFVNRGKISGKPVEDLGDKDKEWLQGELKKLYKGKDPTGHMANFFDCVKDRSTPVSDVFTHHRELSSCHLCNIAMVLKRKLKWDPEKQDFAGDEQATALLKRPQRAGYAFEA